MEYDYKKFEKYLITILEKSQWDGTLDIGEDLSPISEIKVAFDGYGDLETESEYIEQGNTNLESYAIYIHKNSGKRGFVFPEHDSYSFTFGNLVQHRPSEEVCLFAWHEFIDDDTGWSWHIIPLEDRLTEDNSMTAEEIVDILEVLVNRYFGD